MQIVRWNKRFIIGVPYIDGEHERLFRVLNEVYSGFISMGHCQAVHDQFAFFVEQVTAIFSMEEECMRAHAFPKFEQHAREHGDFLQRILTMQSGAGKESTEFSRFSFILIGNWLLSHILQSDSKYGEFTVGRIVQ